MQGNMGFKQLLAVVLIVALSIVNLTFAAAPVGGIQKIEPIKGYAQLNESYTLPKTIPAVLKDKRTVQVAVQWSVGQVSTKKLGTQVIKGKVKDYSGTVSLQLTVTPKIQAIETLQDVAAVHGKLALPKTVHVTYSGGKEEARTVQWVKPMVDTSRLGIIETKGTLTGSSTVVKHYTKVISLFDRVDPLSFKIAEGEAIDLPKTVTAYTANGTKKQVQVQWQKQEDKLDTSVSGTIVVYGLVEGYEKQVQAQFEVRTYVTSIDTMEVSAFWNASYKLPSTVNARMNDNSYKQVPVTWNAPLPDFKEIGVYTVTGKVEDYAGTVKINVRIKSTMYAKNDLLHYSAKFNYFIVSFSKEMSGDVDLSKITLQKKDGTPIGLSYAKPGTTAKSELILVATSPIDVDGIYILTIKPRAVRAVDGEYNGEELVLKTYEYK